MQPGDKLRFKVPLPEDSEALTRLLTPTKERLREVLAERKARREQQAGQAASQKAVWLDTAK